MATISVLTTITVFTVYMYMYTTTTDYVPTGSIFGSSEVAVLERAVSKEKFKEMHSCLPDWSSCDPAQHEQLRAVPVRKLLPAAPLLKTTTKGLPSH